VTERLTHVDETGAARMVDVSGKDITAREATASGRVLVSTAVVALLRGAGGADAGGADAGSGVDPGGNADAGGNAVAGGLPSGPHSGLPKGDALGVARVAGIMAAKRTPELIPLCHPLAISGVSVDLAVEDDAVRITATVRTTDRTGVEMEALTAVSVAALTVIDMVKAVDRSAMITDIRLEAKSGGKSGTWRR
jgi:cyclic pyranopterin phosphate synthase